MKSVGIVQANQENTYQIHRWFHFWLGLLISGVLLYLALRGVNLPQIWKVLQSTNYTLLALALGVGLAGHLVRAVRWGILLEDKPQVGLRFLFTSTMIGYLANNVLPARLGELARIYVLERKTGISKSRAAATVVLERLTDVLLLLGLVGLLSFFLPLPGLVRNGTQIATIGFGTLAVVILFLAFRGKGLLRSVAQTLGVGSQGLGRKVQGSLERFLDGLSVLHSRRQAVFALLFTLLIWGLEATTVRLVMHSLNLSLPWVATLFLLVVLSLSFVIPAAPGALGIYEFFAVVALTPFAVERNLIISLALILHAAGYVMSSIVGLICLWAESMSLRELTRADRG